MCLSTLKGFLLREANKALIGGKSSQVYTCPVVLSDHVVPNFAGHTVEMGKVSMTVLSNNDMELTNMIWMPSRRR